MSCTAGSSARANGWRRPERLLSRAPRCALIRRSVAARVCNGHRCARRAETPRRPNGVVRRSLASDCRRPRSPYRSRRWSAGRQISCRTRGGQRARPSHGRFPIDYLAVVARHRSEPDFGDHWMIFQRFAHATSATPAAGTVSRATSSQRMETGRGLRYEFATGCVTFPRPTCGPVGAVLDAVLPRGGTARAEPPPSSRRRRHLTPSRTVPRHPKRFCMAV